MLLHLIVPRINDYMSEAIVEWIYPAEGQLLGVGAKLLDMTVDLSAAAPHDCPPVSHYRLVLREPAWLRRLTASRRETAACGAPIALFTSAPDESLDAPAARAVRVAIAAIIHQPSWDWS
ncbi:MAG TPA: hypothetical protein VGL73_08710 [Caulobacteraceae bacterium]